MDLNEMELTPSLLAALYTTQLVEAEALTGKPAIVAATDKKPPAGIPFLGKNQQQICILVDAKKDVYLPDDDLNFLTAVLQACRLNLGDVAIINNHRANVQFQQLQQEMGCRQLLLLGVDSTTIGLPALPVFKIEQVDGCAIVVAPPIEQLNNNNAEGKQLKSKLWNCLKQLFNV